MSSSIPAAPSSDVYVFPASFAQQRLWFLDQLHPGQAVYNIPAAIRLRGQLEIPSLQVALQSLVDRHETLRTTFEMEDLELMQCIQSEHTLAFDVVPLHDLPVAEREQQIIELATLEARSPFDLQHGPLLRAKLLAVAEDDHVLLLTMHHIISDGWSLGVFTKEMSAFYNASVAGTTADLPDLEIQYVDYDLYQREWLAGKQHERQLSFWKQQLAGELPLLQLPTDHKRPAMQSDRGASQHFELSKETVEELKRVASQRGCTLFMLLLATYQVLLHRMSGQAEVIVGTPVAGRNLPEVEGLIGFFVNNLTLRADLSEDLLFLEFLDQVSKTTIAAYSHQDTPFEKVVEALQPNRSMSHTPLFQTMFVLQPSPLTQLHMTGLETELLKIESGIAKFDLTFDLIESEMGIQGRVEYCTDLYKQATIERMIGHFQCLLDAILANPNQRVARLPLLTEQERQQLLSGCNQTAPFPISNARCLHERFEEQAHRHPERIAVTCQEESLTYAELNQRANRLAHYLQLLGVQQGARVGICVERSLDIPVAILGVLKAGGTYIPLDPNYPQERLTFLIQDAEISLLLTQQQLLANLPSHLPDHDVQTLCLDAEHDREQMAQQPATNLNGIVAPHDLAYMIYTSGSTGKPKGVMVTHENVMRLFTSTEAWFAFHEEDVWTLFHSFAFDFSVWEMWGALLYGGRMVVVPHLISRSPEAFYELLVQEAVTMLNQTPSAFRQLMQAEETIGTSAHLRLRHVIFGGEALELSSLIPWFERHGDQTPQLVNMYGITETTVHVTYRPLTVADAKAGTGSLIGRPIPDLELYLLDAEQQLVPIGVPGELYVGGAGVAQGYWKRPELTAERFIKHPFSTDPNARLYRTGDIGRRLSDGDIEYLGRIDDQVKVRGFRIELGEIESALCQHPLVRQALVMVRPLGTSEQEVVAYVVPTALSDVSVASLREHVQHLLPAHMMPSAFVLLAEFPLTAHGKVDKKALPHPTVERLERTEYVAPQNEFEQIISDIWQEVLGVSRVGIHDNFFDLGGHSMKIVQVHRLLQARLDEEVTVVDVFQFPTIATLASHLRREKREEAVEIGQQRAERRKRASITISRDDITSQDISIIGMAGRFPGANEWVPYWESLADVDCFDAAFFGYPPREAEIMDPQQRVFLETAWSAMEHAGYDTEAMDKAVGVFAGAGINQYILYNIAPNKELIESVGDFLIGIGNNKDFLATRTSYKLNLHGPSVNVQTDRSTSLVAVHRACQSLIAGECEMALAGGVTVRVPQEKGAVYTDGEITDSTVGVLVLKRLVDAQADGDTIHAVIKGTTVDFKADGMDNTNVGDLGSDAGVIGLIKSVLEMKQALKHQTASVPRRVEVSSHGIGGTNAQVILEESPTPPDPAPSASASWQLLLLSAKTEERLEEATDRLASHLQANAEQDLAGVAYTLQIGRRPFSHRRALVVNTRESAVQTLEQRDPNHLLTSIHDDQQRHVAFVFTSTGTGICEQDDHVTLFEKQYDIASTLIRWGVQPKGMLGESVGEYVAACLAGVFTVEQASTLVAKRAQSTTEEFTRLVRSFTPKAPSMPFISTVTGTWITSEQATSPDYWVHHLSQSVRLDEGLRTLCENKQHVLLEIGSGEPIRSITTIAEEEHRRIVLPVLHDRFDTHDHLQMLLQTVGQLWLCGVQVDFSALHAPKSRTRIPLPTYPFERQRYWINPVQSQNTMPMQSNVNSIDSNLETTLSPHVTQWKSKPVTINRQKHTSLPRTEESWLLFTDDHLGDNLASHARSQGHHVTLVRRGEHYVVHGDDTFTLPAQDANAYVTLLQHIQSTNRHFTKIVHCWSLTPSTVTIAETHDFYSWQLEQELGQHSLLYLSQAITQTSSQPLHIEVISNHVFDLEGSDSISEEKAPLIATCNSIPQENADLTVRLFDIQVPEGDRALKRLLTQLHSDFTSPLTEKTLAYRGRHTWVHV